MGNADSKYDSNGIEKGSAKILITCKECGTQHFDYPPGTNTIKGLYITSLLCEKCKKRNMETLVNSNVFDVFQKSRN